MRSVYLAGPFFNPAQQVHMGMIEEACKKAGVPIFSPRAVGGVVGPKASKEERRRVLESNEHGILTSGCVVAALDWLMPQGQEVRVVDQLAPMPPMLVSPPLNLPDTGTVWEMGFAYARRIPVVALRMDPQGKVNLMLSESFAGLIAGYEELDNFLAIYRESDGEVSIFTKVLKAWKGETQ